MEPTPWIVRVRWRQGRATSADVMWARSRSEFVAAAPVYLAMQVLVQWEDLVLGSFTEPDAEQVRREAEERGHSVELLRRQDYSAAWVESALGCEPVGEEELRVTFLPSFHPEGVVTPRRTPSSWDVEARISRECLWHTHFDAVLPEDWSEVRRERGFNRTTTTVSREVTRTEEHALSIAEELPVPADRAFADGIGIHVRSRLTGATLEHERHCPEKGSITRAAADLALALAAEAAPEWAELIRGYLG